MNDQLNDQFEKNAINPSDENSEKANNKTNTFNLIIGIATLLIALLGATFAYFSATATSAENDVTVKSAYVSISYDGGTEIKASNLIPSTLTVAINKYQKAVDVYNPETDGPIITDYDTYRSDGKDRRCVDANGKEVCYVYQFTIESDGAKGSTTDIVASIKVNRNDFTNLSYILYEVTFQEEAGVVLTDKYGFGIVKEYINVEDNFTYVDKNPDNVDFTETTFDKFRRPTDIMGENGELEETILPVACLFGYNEIEGEKNPETGEIIGQKYNDTSICKEYSITNKEKHTYQLVIWLEETGHVQDEQGALFEGTVSIEVAGGFDSDEYENGVITGLD